MQPCDELPYRDLDVTYKIFHFRECRTNVGTWQLTDFHRAISVRDPVSFGFKWVNYSQNFGQYGSQNSNDFLKPIGFGMQYNLTKKINFGVEISKVSEVGQYDYSIAKSKAGISYLLSESKNSLVSIDYEKSTNNNGSLSIGYKTDLLEYFSLNAGLKNIVSEEQNYNHVSLGISYKPTDTISFNLAMKQNLGSDIVSPLSRILYSSVSYQFK